MPIILPDELKSMLYALHHQLGKRLYDRALSKLSKKEKRDWNAALALQAKFCKKDRGLYPGLKEGCSVDLDSGEGGGAA